MIWGIIGGITIKNKEIYNTIKDKYITIEELNILKKKYKRIDKIIENHNNDYLLKKRNQTKILDNINGYPLDEYQSRVVLSEEQKTLVIAGAGSGKSLTIIGKIVYLIKVKNVNPKDILCISFTNDATINLKKNIKKNYNFDLDIYTFHKLALTILQDNKEEYEIAPDDFLNTVIDNFFLTYQRKYNKELKRILGNKYTEKDIINLKRLINTFISLYKSNNYDYYFYIELLKKIKYTINIKQYLKNKSLLLIIINIYIMYEDELEKENSIDFNDMINKSITSMKEKGLKKKWKYIIIDEYQDTSKTKFDMINKIINITNAKLLVVGDDFQSIYRFTGCNLDLFVNFNKIYKDAKVFQIINTYRNPQELINVAGKFIMKNKHQQQKRLISNKSLKYPIKIYYSDNKIRIFKYLLKNIDKEEILVLGRNNKDIDNYIDKDFRKENDYYLYKDIKFRYLTMHKSKGLESKNVILINIEDSYIGMPTKIKEEQILKYLNKNKNYYPYEEERRLFYVALTRTKNNVYIISSYDKESIFTKELKGYKKYVEVHKKWVDNNLLIKLSCHFRSIIFLFIIRSKKFFF